MERVADSQPASKTPRAGRAARPSGADAARPARLASRTGARRPRDARRAQAAAAAPAARLLDVLRRAAGAELDLRAAVPAQHGAAGQGAVQSVLPGSGLERPGVVDLVHVGRDQRHVQVEGALPAERREGDPDGRVLDAGPVVLEHQRADHPAERAEGHGQREEPKPGYLADRYAPPRLRPDAAAVRGDLLHRAARDDRPAAGGWARWASSGARRRAAPIQRRSASRSTTWPGSTRPRPS